MDNLHRFGSFNPMDTFGQGMGVGQLYQQNVAAEQARIAEEQRQAEYQNLFNTAMGPGATGKDWLRLFAATPEDKLAALKEGYANMQTADREQLLKSTGEMVSALDNSRPDLVRAELMKQRIAAENAGDSQTIREVDNFLGMLDQPNGPELLKGSLLLGVQGVEGGTDLITARDTMLGMEKTEQEMELDILELARTTPFTSEADKNRALTMVQGMNMRQAEKVVNIASILSNMEGMTSKDIVDAYLPIEKEYNDLVEGSDIVLQNAANLEALQFVDGGAASQSMITLFNKVTDPNSVVRQSEFANTAEAAGAINTIEQLWPKFMSGEALGEDARQRLVTAAQVIANAAEREKIRIQEDLGALIDEAGLKRDVIFKSAGTMEENEFNRGRLIANAAFETKGSITGSSSQEIQNAVDIVNQLYPNDDAQRAKAFAAAAWPDEADKIYAMTYQELLAEYKNTLAHLGYNVEAPVEDFEGTEES